MTEALTARQIRGYKRDRRLGKLYLFLFFLFVGIHKAEQLQQFYTGISLKTITIITPLFIPPIFLVLALFKYNKIHVKTRETTSGKQFSLISYLFIGFTFLLTLYGLLIGNPTFYITTEIWIYFIVILCIFLGRYDAVWEDMYKPLVILFWVFFVPVYAATYIPKLEFIESGVADYLIEKHGSLTGTGTLAYQMYPILDFFPIIFVMSAVRKKTDIWKILGICSILGYLGMHIFFAKRAPSVRAVTYIFMIFFTLQLVNLSFKNMFKIAVPALIGLMALTSMVSIDGLMDRLSKSSEDKSRQNEVAVLLQQLNAFEWVAGRGFGGYFELGSSREEYGLGAYEIKEGVFGKVNMHIAFFYPLLKGGLVFLILTLSLSLPLIYRWRDRKWMNNRYNFTAFCILSVIFLYQFIEGPFSSGMTFLGVLYGLCWGRVGTSLHQFSLRYNLKKLESS